MNGSRKPGSVGFTPPPRGKRKPTVTQRGGSRSPASTGSRGVTRNIASVSKDWEPPAPDTTDILIKGKTLQDAFDQLNRLPEWGRGGGSIQADKIPVGTSTDLTVTLHANLERRMPKWEGIDGASAAAKAEWKRMWAKLKAHEDRHVAIAIEEADRVADALIGHDISDIAKMVTAANKTMSRRQKELDRATQHGARKGVPYGDVSLDTNIR